MNEKIEEIYKTIKKDYSKISSIGIASGMCGLILFLFYYYKLTNNRKAHELANNLLIKVIDKINHGDVYPSFSNGIAGVGWLIEHLEQNNFIECDTNAILDDIDSYIFQSVKEDLNSHEFDFLHGGIGKGIYFLTRKKDYTEYLEEILNLILEISEIPMDNQLRWKSSYGNTDKSIFNLSISHGIASLINFGSRLYSKNIAKENSSKIIHNSINYLLNYENSNMLSLFPNFVFSDGTVSDVSRLAWCYGDLGIGVTLWQASQSLACKSTEEKSLKIFHHSKLRRNLKLNMVVDAGLCHGTAGIAHIFNRMYINTKIPEFKETSEFWFNETLKMAKFNDGLAGYKIWRTLDNGGWITNHGFLEGISGIGLALISAVSDIEPAWDECLLLS